MPDPDLFCDNQYLHPQSSSNPKVLCVEPSRSGAFPAECPYQRSDIIIYKGKPAIASKNPKGKIELCSICKDFEPMEKVICKLRKAQVYS